jgi:hypothetical protein
METGLVIIALLYLGLSISAVVQLFSGARARRAADRRSG